MINNIEELMQPAKKLVGLNKVQVEKAVEAQQLSAKEFMALTEARMKAITEIKDVPSFNSFMTEQFDCAQGAIEKMIANSKVLFEEAKTYNEEVIKLMREGNGAMTKEMTEAVKKEVKKVA